MQCSITFKNLEASEALKEYCQEKLGRLEKYLDSVMEVEVLLSVSKFRHKAEILINSDGLKINAEEETDDMYSAIDLVLDKLEKQIKKQKEKVKDRKAAFGKRQASKPVGKQGMGFEASDNLDDEDFPDLPPIDKVSSLKLETLNVSEAAEKLARGQYSWYAFKNEDDGKIYVIHQQKDGLLDLTKLN